MEILQQAEAFVQEYSVFFMAGSALLIIALIIWNTVLNSKINKLTASYNDFMKGNDGKTLEDIMKRIVEDNKKVKLQCKHDIDAIVEMKKGLKDTYKKLGIVKYDTFRGMSGKLSFSVALIDGANSGFVLSSMHTQDGCYSYLKEIIHGESHTTLSNEERDALNMALNYDSDKIIADETACQSEKAEKAENAENTEE